jgi:2-keto-4-pentenoate hydratase/2-oxohepta-3-ene-1,7-dioic acid hydratase in catechol pathway
MPPPQYALATVAHEGRAHACIERGGTFFPLARLDLPDDLVTVFAHWAEVGPKVERAATPALRGGWSAGEVRVLTPLQYPGKVLCAGANYYDHLEEMGVRDLRKEAQRLFFFFKPPRNALVGPGRTVRYPARTKMFDWEIELAAVIGRRARDLSPDNALDCVAGYTVAIDLSARDLNQAPETFYKLDWVAGKAQDTCCPLGPRIVPAALVGDPHDLALELKVNGATKQSARTSGMIFDIREQLALLSSIMTLDPGDVLLTGTPAGVGFPKRTFLAPGDRITATIERIGTLEVEIE